MCGGLVVEDEQAGKSPDVHHATRLERPIQHFTSELPALVPDGQRSADATTSFGSGVTPGVFNPAVSFDLLACVCECVPVANADSPPAVTFTPSSSFRTDVALHEAKYFLTIRIRHEQINGNAPGSTFPNPALPSRILPRNASSNR